MRAAVQMCDNRTLRRTAALWKLLYREIILHFNALSKVPQVSLHGSASTEIKKVTGEEFEQRTPVNV